MAFADDLLKDAHHLAARGGKNPRQSSLQRAVSTAYYALFHLLIGDFVLNWRRPDQRVRLGRMFDHRKMIQAKLSRAPRRTPLRTNLKKVIDAFAQLQEDRHTADYDFGRNWSRVDVTNTLALADEAFIAWRNVRKEKIAQDHVPDNVRGSKDVNRQPNRGTQWQKEAVDPRWPTRARPAAPPQGLRGGIKAARRIRYPPPRRFPCTLWCRRLRRW